MIWPIPIIVGVLVFLHLVLRREFVKSDLRQRICEPISVRWRPFPSTRLTSAFKVIYSDFHGQIHRATCWTYGRDVTWETDEIIGHTDDTMA
jgi:hypothetical protein